MTHGSLFSGIGGFDLGFRWAGIPTLWQVEIEDYPRQVLQQHFPDAKRYSDIRSCGKHNLEWVDVISGGFPCQDISHAGKRIGIDGERSGLWSEMRRIICELRPRFVIVENVAALLGRGMERVLGDLAESGFDAEWDVLPASAFGAPHRRERVFVVAYPKRNGLRNESGRTEPEWSGATIPGNNGTQEHVAYSRRRIEQSRDEWTSAERTGQRTDECSQVAYANGSGFREQRRTGPIRPQFASAECCSQDLADAAEYRLETGWTTPWIRPTGFTESNWWAIEPDVGRVAHGVPARVDRLKGLGNAVVPQIAEWIGQRIARVYRDRA